MSTKISLSEAASFLGVSRATLRNWDKDKKLQAERNPVNGYRTYNLNDIVKLKKELGAVDHNDGAKPDERTPSVDAKLIKSLISRLHAIIRNHDASSNIITRFDEISKLLFLKLSAEKKDPEFFSKRQSESNGAYLSRLQKMYHKSICESPIVKPKDYSQLKISPDAIVECGKELSKISLTKAACDIKGLAYEDAIKSSFDKNDNQQFFTPYQIVNFMVGMFQNFLNGIVCDPACGTAGFLCRTSQFNNKIRLLGLEVDERLAWVSSLNLLIHGYENFTIEHLKNGGSLGKDAKKYFNKIDTILTNPPFGSDYTDQNILNNFSLGKNRSSRRRGILFIEQIWNLLTDNGHAAVVIDQSVLNAASCLDVRQYILSHFKILAIVDLPETAFMPYATVNTSILFLQKAKSVPKQGDVFFAKSHNIGRKSNGDDDFVYSENGEVSLNCDLDNILKQWEAFNKKKSVEGDCFVTTLLFDEDDSLRLDYLYHHPFRRQSKEALNKSVYELVPLAELCDERNESIIPSTELNVTAIQFTGLANIASFTGNATRAVTPTASIKSAVKRYEYGDIIFSKMRPALRKCAVMRYEDGGYASSECTILFVRQDKDGKKKIDPDLLCALLRSDFVFGQIMSRITGIGRPRISGKDLRNIQIPVPPENIQRQALAAMDSAAQSARQLKEKAKLLLDEANQLEANSLTNISNIMAGF